MELYNNRLRIIFKSLIFIGSIFLLVTGVNAILNDYKLISIIVLSMLASTLFNYFYYLLSDDIEKSCFYLGVNITILCLLLVISGGVKGSGMFWVYPLLSVLIFINPVKKGGCFSFLFVVLVSLFLFSPYRYYDYTFHFSIRFIVSLIATCVVCLVVCYINESLILNLKKSNKDLDEIANVDALTKLFNRTFLYKNIILNDRFDDLLSDNSVVLLIDIDCFKSINDKYGHDVGDEVLRQVSSILKKHTRDADIVSRWGGEEFLVILRDLNINKSYKKAELIRKSIEEHRISFGMFNGSATVSIGVSAVKARLSANQIIKKADERLYLAKNQGRNKVF
ncbi:GGDEF domain-containing protein [Vibrio sp. SNU_ST1]|uniref:GGDEF domain-containing protein n=1 Tax=Vibrio sp. SNU_ST1 TaxID=3064001 RepID=UPI00272D061E|nr:GGDEF domain-containing protein [Vibrio sp. SNU_ST1]WKY59154.1 GGDEF domain-containing protein [Vibrio sp. SNU_ST1]